MKLRISNTTIVDVKDILVAELDDKSIRIRFKNNFDIVEFYDTKLESTFIFNNIMTNMDIFDARFNKAENIATEDERKEKAFEMFWNLYDKKIDVTRCRKAFMQLSLKQMGEAVKGVVNYVNSTPDKKFRKNATTWINNMGWKNEVLTDKKSNRYIKPKYVQDER
tara:strand:- start:1448 stop:1942 length:495 start_codon:yes stop_codon:yes gene_type:complete